MNNPGVIAALITAIGIAAASLVATFVKKGTDKQSAALTAEQQNDDQRQKDLEAARKAASDARAEADNARKLLSDESDRYRLTIADMWKQIGALNEEMARMRARHQAEIDALEEHIVELKAWYSSGAQPPPPARKMQP